MKTFTATQLNKSPQEIFAAAKEDGDVLIEHDRHEGVFIISHVSSLTDDDKVNLMVKILEEDKE